jgi:hypothetical protein
MRLDDCLNETRRRRSGKLERRLAKRERHAGHSRDGSWVRVRCSGGELEHRVCRKVALKSVGHERSMERLHHLDSAGLVLPRPVRRRLPLLRGRCRVGIRAGLEFGLGPRHGGVHSRWGGCGANHNARLHIKLGSRRGGVHFEIDGASRLKAINAGLGRSAIRSASEDKRATAYRDQSRSGQVTTSRNDIRQTHRDDD